MDDPKALAAHEALRLVRPGMTVGLGTGSTATHFIEQLAVEVQVGRLHGVVGIPTSDRSDQLARLLGIPIVGFDTHPRCDLTVDGADEADGTLDLIKGLGGALLREKLVAQNSERLVIIVDASKRVARLGTKGPLPVEVTRFGLPAHERFVRDLGAEPTLRLGPDGGPFVTDNGNHILDCRWPGGVADPAAIASALSARAGIVEHGLFLGLAECLIVAHPDGRVEQFERR